MELKNLKELTLLEMEAFLDSIGQQKYRAKQIFKWIHRGVGQLDQMTDLSKPLREKLSQMCYISTLKAIKVQESATEGTKKYLFELEDGNAIETVFMKYKYGNSICVSSQAGCRMGCSFCASGIGGIKRNLSSGEILDQLLQVQNHTEEKISHIVVMGTGEPFDNYENLKKFIHLANSKDGLNIGMRNITVSTCGLIPMIEKFGDDFAQVNLAISLHGANNYIREQMVPINKTYPIEELLPACRRYTKKTGRRITFEYALAENINDSVACANELVGRLVGMNCHVNLIPLNSVQEVGISGSNRAAVGKFMNVLATRGIQCTVRRELGSDIDAACGQLRIGENKAAN